MCPRYFLQFPVINVKGFLTWRLWICLIPLWAHLSFWPDLCPTGRSSTGWSHTQGTVHTYARFSLLPGYFHVHPFVLLWGETVSRRSLIILVILLLCFFYILLVWDDSSLQVMFKMWVHDGFIYRHDDVFSFVPWWTLSIEMMFSADSGVGSTPIIFPL